LKKTLRTLVRYLNEAQILVINDGGEIPQGLPSRIQILNLPSNIGEASVVNLGWEMAETDLFTVISDDDPQLYDWLHPLLDEARINPNAIVFYPSTSVVKSDLEIQRIPAIKYEKDKFLGLLRSPCLAGVLINRKELTKLGVTKLRVDEMIYPNDLIQWLELTKFGEFVPVNRSIATWVRHDLQASEILSKYVQSKQFYQNVTRWQYENLGKEALIDAYTIAFLRSAQILLSPSREFDIWKLKEFLKLYGVHKNFLEIQGIKTIRTLRPLIVKSFRLAQLKVRDARS
jgi:hypothetical protein